MGQTNLLLENWQQQEKIFIDTLVISRKKPTKNSTHDLRVATKKMRSYLRLKKQLTGEEWKESFLKLYALFKSFGLLSDFNTSISLVRKQERKEGVQVIFFKEYLSVNRALAKKWAKRDAKNFNEQELDIFKQHLEITLTDKEIVERIIELSISKLKKAKMLSQHFEKNAHEIRKQLKDVYYWLKICPEELAENFIDLKALDKILDCLGDWQDHFTVRKKINRYRKDLPKKNEEKQLLKKFENNLASSQHELLQNARDTWKEIEYKNNSTSLSSS